jgi:1-hydroxycarotenoid 3,4-desaturase
MHMVGWIVPRKKVVIIGSGVGGLAAAMRLSAAGCDVTVVEKEATPGGKMRQLFPSGRPIDAGPTVFTMRWVFEDLFNACGVDFGNAVTLKPLTILARHAWSTTEALDLHADIAASADAIGVFAGAKEAQGYRDFCAAAAQTFATLREPFLRSGATTPWGLTGRIGFTRIGEMASIRPFSSFWTSLGRFFHDPRLRQLFGRYATYCGSSPFRAPATLMLIAHVEQEGVWAVDGGMHAVAKAMEKAARGAGADVRYGSGVSSIVTKAGRIDGVALANGDMLAADIVVANCDPSAIAIGRLGNDTQRAVPAVNEPQRSLSALCWVAEGQADGFDLAHHNVFFGGHYAGEFDDIATRYTPHDPTVYLCAQDRSADGPVNGQERFQIIVNARANGDSKAFSEEEKAACQTTMINRLQKCGLSLSLPPDRTILTTPPDFEALFPASGGALYGRATHGWAAAFQRPGSRTRLPGLYLAGGATHPGAGVPMAALSGCRAAEAIIADSNLTPP